MMTMKQVCEEIADARIMKNPRTNEPMSAEDLWRDCTPNGELFHLFVMLDQVRALKKLRASLSEFQ